ncbi:MAG TPA: glycosyltransferase family 39 protein [Vicinamibacterales bacterium]
MDPRPPTRVVVRIALCAAGFRIVSAVLAFLVNLTFPPAPPTRVTMFGAPSAFWDPFTRFDAGWYYQIARYGYLFVPGGPSAGVGKAGKIAYFPLYPLLMRYASRLFGHTAADVYLGGIFISWAAFTAAMVALFFLARLDLPRVRAERSVLLTAIFPFSFFFGMVYTESLFLLLTVLAFYGFRTRRWALGGVCGGLASATRVNGILLLPALAWIAWRNAEPTLRDRLLAAIGLLLVGSGIAVYSLYVYRISGNPFEWASSISRWGYHPGGLPWLAPVHLVARLATHPYLYLTTDRMAVYDTLYGVTGVLFVVAVPFVWYRFGAGYGLFMIANLWLPLSSGVFEGVGRYCSVLFPCFFLLATIRSRAVSTAIVVAFALFYTLGLALFTSTHPLF